MGKGCRGRWQRKEERGEEKRERREGGSDRPSQGVPVRREEVLMLGHTVQWL